MTSSMNSTLTLTHLLITVIVWHFDKKTIKIEYCAKSHKSPSLTYTLMIQQKSKYKGLNCCESFNDYKISRVPAKILLEVLQSSEAAHQLYVELLKMPVK